MNHMGLQPIIILGAARSGTKFLRSLLEVSDLVATIPYDVGYLWRYGNEGVVHDELSPELITPKIRNYIRETLLALVDGDEKRFILEKSVPNTLRAEFVRQIFPEAKFIHLVRDGRAVTESSIRSWQSKPDLRYILEKVRYFPLKNYRYALWYLTNNFFRSQKHRSWGPRYEGIDNDIAKLPLHQVCARQWRRCVESCQSQISTFSKDKVITVSYEDLVADESKILEICGFVGIGEVDPILERYRFAVQRGENGKWGNLPEHIQAEIVEEISGTLVSIGYEPAQLLE